VEDLELWDDKEKYFLQSNIKGDENFVVFYIIYTISFMIDRIT